MICEKGPFLDDITTSNEKEPALVTSIRETYVSEDIQSGESRQAKAAGKERQIYVSKGI
jgi:hypothetical protein